MRQNLLTCLVGFALPLAIDMPHHSTDLANFEIRLDIISQGLTVAELFKINGFKVVIFSDDHDPPHIHSRKGNFEVKIDISGESAKLMAGEENSRRADDKKPRKQALKIADDNLAILIKEWERIDEERG